MLSFSCLVVPGKLVIALVCDRFNMFVLVIYYNFLSGLTCDPVFTNEELQKITSEPSVPVKIQRLTDNHLARSIQTDPVKRVLRSNHVEDHSWQHEPMTNQSPKDVTAYHDSRPETFTMNVSHYHYLHI